MTRTLALMATLLTVMSAFCPLHAEIPLNPIPVWQGAEGNLPCGIAWADIDGNGWPDLVLGNGLDVFSRPNEVYFNCASGLALRPGWTSTDLNTHCVLAAGDLDNDGDPDVVVPSLGLVPAFQAERYCIYYNNDGLSESPDWYSDTGISFACALGDPDRDGDLDIAFVQGISATQDSQKTVMYVNNGGRFASKPAWESDERFYGTDVSFCDIDLDGDLDLIAGGRIWGIGIFYNREGRLETTPSWRTNSVIGGRQIAPGDVDRDGFPDLAVAVGDSLFCLLRNHNGTLAQEPDWTCRLYSQPSCVAWGDVDADGDLDLAACGWNMPVGVFENKNGELSGGMDWSITVPGSPQEVVWFDYDADGVADTVETFTCDGVRNLFYVSQTPIHQLTSLSLDDSLLSPRDYCCYLPDGWLSLARPPRAGARLSVHYQFSRDLDLTATAWDASIFENTTNDASPAVQALLIMDHEQGANWDIEDASPSIMEQFRGYGWRLTTAGPDKKLQRCEFSNSAGLKPLTVDLRLSEIENVDKFDVVCLLPNRNGMPNVLGDTHTLDLLRRAAGSGKVVAAWCRSVRVLAEAGLLKGLDIVGHADYQAAYETAGAKYLGNDHPPVRQRNIVTGVRSRFYREAMCQAIREALPPTVRRVIHRSVSKTDEGEVLRVLARMYDSDGIASASVSVDTGGVAFMVPMREDGQAPDSIAGDSVSTAVLPPVTAGKLIHYFIEITDSSGVTYNDPPEAPLRRYRR